MRQASYLFNINRSINQSTYKASAPTATSPSNPAKVVAEETRPAPPSDSSTFCTSEPPEAEAVEPRVEDEVVMLAVLLPDMWDEAEEAMAPAVEEVIMLESVMVMLMLLMESVVLELSLAVEDAMEEDAMEELALGAALLVLSITKGGV